MGTAFIGMLAGCVAVVFTPVGLLLAVPFLVEVAARSMAVWRDRGDAFGRGGR